VTSTTKIKNEWFYLLYNFLMLNVKGELGELQIYFKKISLSVASTKVFGSFGSF